MSPNLLFILVVQAVLGRSLTAAVGNELPERAVSAGMTRLPAIHNNASSSLLLARMREDDIGAPVRTLFRRHLDVLCCLGDDFKVVIRPQGGLDLSKTNAAQLADCIFHQTKITDFAQDHVCINTRSNFIAVSTPDERRSQQYMDLDTITWNATHYPVQSHIPPPSITTPGAIFQIPAEDSEPLIIESLTRHNPTITVLHARRIKDTGIVQVLFLGPHVPFWVRYRAVILRCYPYKGKTEACMACWSAGHRRDVCPKPSPKPHCTICGTLGPTPNHPCQPRCIPCGQDHVTVSAEMTRLPAIHNNASSSLLLARMREDDIGAPVRCTLSSSLRMKTPALDIRTPTATAVFSGRGETA
ncbi:hypothetical protein HPB47_008767, partial [Ixodes persulcatus]